MAKCFFYWGQKMGHIKKRRRNPSFFYMFFKVQESIKFSMAESYMLSSIQPLNMLNLLIIN